MCTAQEIAEKVGQDKPAKEAVEVYDKSHGSYQPHPHNHKTVEPLNQPKPIRGLGEKK